MRQVRFSLSAGLLLLALLAPCGLLVLGQSAPILLNFQGRLTNSVGAPITALTGIQLTLLRGGTASESVSTGTIVYQETASVTPDANGVFTHVVGTGTPVGGQTLVAEDFDTSGVDLFIETSISGEILLPRTQVLSVPYAIESSRVGGLTAQAIIGQAGGNAFANAVVRNGAGLEWLSATQVKVNPGTLGFPDGVVRRNTTSLTWDFANGTGALGLDQGVEAADTWYYLYAIPDSGDDTQFTAVASINIPTQSGGTGPVGFATHRYVGAFRNAGSNIRRFFWSQNRIISGGFGSWWLFSCTGALPVVDTWVAVDASAYMPETAHSVILGGYYDAWGAAAVRFQVGPGPPGPPFWNFFCVDWENGASNCERTVPTISRTFSYYADLYSGRTNDANQCVEFTFQGYLEDLSNY